MHDEVSLGINSSVDLVTFRRGGTIISVAFTTNTGHGIPFTLSLTTNEMTFILEIYINFIYRLAKHFGRDTASTWL